MSSVKTPPSKPTSSFKPPAFPKVLESLTKNGGEVYLVGGPVRDCFLARKTKDLDILVRKLSFEQIKKLLQPLGKIILVGKSFGVLKFSPHNSEDEFDIALPRTEKSTGTGHKDFEVSFDQTLPVATDLQRRDFTINAMAYDFLKSQLIDPHNGQADLNNNLLRQVHANSFPEDPLRLLRAIQFSARFNLAIEPETLVAMKQHAELIETVSPERITYEVGKLFLAERPSVGFCIMRDTGILKYVFPELHKTVGVEQGKKLANDDVFLHTMRVLDASRSDKAIPLAGDMELMLAALFHDVGKPRTKRFDKAKQRLTFYGHQTLSRKLAEKRMRELKMTTLGINPGNVATLVEHHMFQAKSYFTEKAIRRFIQSIGEELVLKLVDLRTADNRGGKYPDGIHGVQRLRKRIVKELAKKPALTVSDLEISGHDLMELGIPAGPALGAILKKLIDIVIDDPEKNKKETLLTLVRDTLGHQPT